MTDKTKIEWCDSTWNPVRGCSIVSKGCTNCYAMKTAHRFSGGGQPYEGLTMMSNGGPVWNGKITLVPELLDQPLRWKRPRRIFVNSMSDLFHESIPFKYIASVFAIMGATTRHTYQILTKRPERMLEFFKWVHEECAPNEFCADDRILEHWPEHVPHDGYDNCGPLYPYENVWIGVSVEDQKTADERISLLLKTPAAIRFISAEPLLGDIDMAQAHNVSKELLPRIDWGIVGTESGHNRRVAKLEWVQSIVDQFQFVDVPIFVKQIELNGKVETDIDKFPEGLRVREFPA